MMSDLEGRFGGRGKGREDLLLVLLLLLPVARVNRVRRSSSSRFLEASSEGGRRLSSGACEYWTIVKVCDESCPIFCARSNGSQVISFLSFRFTARLHGSVSKRIRRRRRDARLERF